MHALIVQLEDATQSLPGTISASTALETLEGWDSLGMVAFISIVADQSGLELAMDDLKECATAGDLHHLLQTRAACAAP